MKYLLAVCCFFLLVQDVKAEAAPLAGAADLPDRAIYLEVVEVRSDSLALAVKAKNIQQVFGAAFKLEFAESNLQYVDYELSGLLAEKQDLLHLAGISAKNGELVVGFSVKREQDLIGGSGELIRIKFALKQAGQVQFDFQDSQLFTLQKKKPQKIEDISWFNLKLDMQSNRPLAKTGPSLMPVVLLSLSLIFILHLRANHH